MTRDRHLLQNFWIHKPSRIGRFLCVCVCACMTRKRLRKSRLPPQNPQAALPSTHAKQGHRTKVSSYQSFPGLEDAGEGRVGLVEGSFLRCIVRTGYLGVWRTDGMPICVEWNPEMILCPNATQFRPLCNLDQNIEPTLARPSVTDTHAGSCTCIDRAPTCPIGESPFLEVPKLESR